MAKNAKASLQTFFNGIGTSCDRKSGEAYASPLFVIFCLVQLGVTGGDPAGLAVEGDLVPINTAFIPAGFAEVGGGRALLDGHDGNAFRMCSCAHMDVAGNGDVFVSGLAACTLGIGGEDGVLLSY